VSIFFRYLAWGWRLPGPMAPPSSVVIAFQNNDPHAGTLLLAVPPTDPEDRLWGAGGWHALHWAVRHNNRDHCRDLLAHGVPVDAPTRDACARTPLALAASLGRTALCRLLLQSGASLAITDFQGRTPLEVASAHGHPLTAHYLASQTLSPVDPATCHRFLIPRIPPPVRRKPMQPMPRRAIAISFLSPFAPVVSLLWVDTSTIVSLSASALLVAGAAHRLRRGDVHLPALWWGALLLLHATWGSIVVFADWPQMGFRRDFRCST
jgi:hypothetical protein